MQWRPRRRDGRPIDVLVVCTGNVCRSPYIAARLAAAFPTAVIDSAGTTAVRGALPTDEIRDLLRERDVEAVLRPTKQLTARQVRNSRLIVTATRAHRGAVVSLVPSASHRAFTLKELGRGALAQPGDLEALIALCDSWAQEVGSADRDDDLADPYGLDSTAYLRMADEADRALGPIIDVIGLSEFPIGQSRD